MTEAKPVRVVCVKSSGARVLFKEYPADQLGQARIDVKALRGHGIDAAIEGDLDQAPANAGHDG
jgi:hypothetical protein